MKKIILTTCVTLFIFTAVTAQHTEFKVSLNSGLFSFSGESAEKVTSINYNDQSKSGYTNNPYGSKSGLSYGVSLNVKRLFHGRFIAGLDFGYEILRSKISINKVVGYTGASTYEVNASGQTFLSYNCVNLNPFIGYRINLRKFNIDLTGGLDLARIMKATETGEATDENGIVYRTSRDRKTIERDISPRVQISADYGRYGIYLGNSAGLRDYMTGFVGGTNQCFSRITRFGVTYKFKTI